MSNAIASAIERVLRNDPTFTILQLTDEQRFTDDHANALAMALLHNPSLRQLKLAETPITAAGAKAIAAALERNVSLQTLCLCRNGLRKFWREHYNTTQHYNNWICVVM